MLTQAKTLLVSDVHLGTPTSHAEHLYRLLREVQPRQLVLVGDIIDLKAMHQRAYWHPLHTACVQRVLAMARAGTEVIFIPGNHDAEFRQQVGSEIHGVRIERQIDYVAVDGATYRVSHGDEYDQTGLGHAPWMEALGETLYEMLCRMNRWYNLARRRFDLDYQALSVAVKRRVGKAMAFIEDFEDRVIAGAAELGVDGHICGHIHYANIRHAGNVAYLNTGDWVENCTVLGESKAGGFELWHVASRSERLASLAPDWWRSPHALPTAA